MVTGITGISFRSERNSTKKAGKKSNRSDIDWTQYCKNSTKFTSFRKILLNFHLFEDKVRRKGQV